MDITFIKNPENNIYGAKRRQNEDRHGGKRVLKSRGCTLKGADDRWRQTDLPLRVLNSQSRLVQRSSEGEIKGESNCGDLSLVVYGERRQGGSIMCQGAQRDHSSRICWNVDLLQ